MSSLLVMDLFQAQTLMPVWLHLLWNSKRSKEPKIPKLKGGYSSDAALFFNSWSKDIQACVTGRRLSDLEAIQLVKETTEGGALKEIQFYLDTSPNVSYNGLMSHLEVAYTSGEDASIISRDFYG